MMVRQTPRRLWPPRLTLVSSQFIAGKSRQPETLAHARLAEVFSSWSMRILAFRPLMLRMPEPLWQPAVQAAALASPRTARCRFGAAFSFMFSPRFTLPLRIWAPERFCSRPGKILRAGGGCDGHLSAGEEFYSPWA